MKKGCFIKTVIIGTILIAAIVYIIQYKLEDWLVTPGKELLLSKVSKNWDSELKFVYDSPEKDSMKSLFNYYVDNITSLNEVAGKDEKSFADEFKSAIKDSVISQDELSKLTLLVKKEINEK